jgi:transposase
VLRTTGAPKSVTLGADGAASAVPDGGRQLASAQDPARLSPGAGAAVTAQHAGEDHVANTTAARLRATLERIVEESAMSELYELVPAIVERQLHIQEKLRCKCGETVITADGPTKVFDKARVGPTFMAQVAVSKCADALPLHRQAKAYRRVGVQVNDSTLGDYFHRTAEITKPISDRLLDVVGEKEIVLADETSQRVQAKGKTRRSWLWSFIAKDEDDREMIAYVFSPSRSSETPDRVLEGTAGKLVADAYKGYDRVTLPGRRVRAGCLAHVRRKFFDAQSAAPDAAKRAMDFILEVYKIERAALDADLLGTPEHLEMRQTASRAVMDNFKSWLDAEQPRHPPKGPMGEAISYALGQWDALTLFLTDPHLPIDNNASERALRVAALGRNYADLVIMRSQAGRARHHAWMEAGNST